MARVGINYVGWVARSVTHPTILALLLTGIAHAQEFPTKPIRIIVGPGPDIVARMLGQKFTEAWGHQTIVEQRPGGGGIIATEMVAKAPPDGYTLLLSSAAYTINAVLQPGPYDLTRDFASIALCATSPFILTVHPSVPAKSVQALIALAKSKPGNWCIRHQATARRRIWRVRCSRPWPRWTSCTCRINLRHPH